MKLILQSPGLFDIFQKDPLGNAIALVEESHHRWALLTLPDDGCAIRIPVDTDEPARLYPGSIIKFNSKGEFVERPETARANRRPFPAPISSISMGVKPPWPMVN